MRFHTILKILLSGTTYLLFFLLTANAQEDLRTIRFDKLLLEIENEIESTYELRNAIVDMDFAQSEGSVLIRKRVLFENVHFVGLSFFENFRFEKSVIFRNSGPFAFFDCTFEDDVEIKIDREFVNPPLVENEFLPKIQDFVVWFVDAKFVKGVELRIDGSSISKELNVEFSNSKLSPTFETRSWQLKNVGKLRVVGGSISNEQEQLRLVCDNVKEIEIEGNHFLGKDLFVRIGKHDRVNFDQNIIGRNLFLDVLEFKDDDYFNWPDVDGKLISWTNYERFRDIFFEDDIDGLLSYNDSIETIVLDTFLNFVSVNEVDYYNRQLSFLGKFLHHYKLDFNRDWANGVYRDIKDLETRRYKYVHKLTGRFDDYFQFKINQFLRLFSDYGTRPSKAILISLYVILIFAFFYLLFPNSWDENNRHRVMNRMLFFTKYFRRDEGMKEVFEEDMKSGLMAFEEFKNYMNESKQLVPPYFLSLSKPLYKLSISNYRIRSKILEKADILKGKWIDLPPKRRIFTSIVMAFWLVGILLYDLFVKFFNALMLLINTFSTLGFGEIPIKGIPRYLAILQGFLGWFMLSIFSVSLISQLLN